LFFNKKGFFVILPTNLYDQKMKKIVIIIAIIGFLISCTKDDNDVTSKVIEITINLSNNQVYDYVLGRFPGDNDFTEIVSQASHFELSEIVVTPNTGHSIYKYKPQVGFIGDDFVELTSEKKINIDSDKIEANTIKLTFKIVD